jgi:predicted restriction endonuclease
MEFKEKIQALLKAVSSRKTKDDEAFEKITALSVMTKRTLEMANGYVGSAKDCDVLVSEAISKIEQMVGLLASSMLRHVKDDEDVQSIIFQMYQDFVNESPSHDEHPINSPEVRKHVLAMTDGKCSYCGKTLSDAGAGNHADAFCVEHVVPLSEGGPNHIKNYVPACGSCNSAKGDRHVLTFIKKHVARRVEQAQLRVVGGN